MIRFKRKMPTNRRVVILGFLLALTVLSAVPAGPEEIRGEAPLQGPEGNYDRHEIALTYGPQTLFTDGDHDLDLMALEKDREVDVEYDPRTRMVTYVFVYL